LSLFLLTIVFSGLLACTDSSKLSFHRTIRTSLQPEYMYLIRLRNTSIQISKILIT
jgi:hypothetical protein